MSKRLTIHLVTSVVIICFYVASYNALLQKYDSTKQRTNSNSGIWNLPSLALLVVAGEFKGIIADYLTLEAGARLGTELIRKPEGGFQVAKKHYDWSTIHSIFVASQVLDPSFAQTFILAHGWLPWEPANMVIETQKILEVAARNRPWDWQPAHAMGFNAYYFLNQPGEAGKIFLEAARIPNAPPFLTILGARLAQKGGETVTAISVLKSMLIGKDPEEPGYNEVADRLHALEGVQVIEQAAERYEKNFGRRPLSLEILVLSGILPAIPPNPYNLSYCMDAEGAVYFDKPDCKDSKH